MGRLIPLVSARAASWWYFPRLGRPPCVLMIRCRNRADWTPLIYGNFWTRRSVFLPFSSPRLGTGGGVRRQRPDEEQYCHAVVPGAARADYIAEMMLCNLPSLYHRRISHTSKPRLGPSLVRGSRRKVSTEDRSRHCKVVSGTRWRGESVVGTFSSDLYPARNAPT